MSERALFPWLVWAMFGLAAVTLLSVAFITAPYGRHARGGWGPTVPSRLGWIFMESPPVVGFITVFALGAHRSELVPLALLALWQLHYVHRTLVFPFRLNSGARPMPAVIALTGFAFNCFNAYLNARWISHFGAYPRAWLFSPQFLAGAAVMLAGFVINLHADQVLLNLRKPGERGYKIPHGGLYRWISCPNYLGEMLEWAGWAVASWSLPGLAFALYTVANLAPRAVAHHAWYRRTFPEYPAGRKALVPFVL